MATHFHCNTFVTKENIRATVRISVEINETETERIGGTQCRQLDTSGWNRKLVPLYHFPQRHTQKTWYLHERCCENLRPHVTCCLYDIYSRLSCDYFRLHSVAASTERTTSCSIRNPPQFWLDAFCRWMVSVTQVVQI
jgi:hypothetical protein